MARASFRSIKPHMSVGMSIGHVVGIEPAYSAEYDRRYEPGITVKDVEIATADHISVLPPEEPTIRDTRPMRVGIIGIGRQKSGAELISKAIKEHPEILIVDDGEEMQDWMQDCLHALCIQNYYPPDVSPLADCWPDKVKPWKDRRRNNYKSKRRK